MQLTMTMSMMVMGVHCKTVSEPNAAEPEIECGDALSSTTRREPWSMILVDYEIKDIVWFIEKRFAKSAKRTRRAQQIILFFPVQQVPHLPQMVVLGLTFVFDYHI